MCDVTNPRRCSVVGVTKEKGRNHERRLADLSVVPPTPEPEWAPYREGTRDESYTVDLLGGSRIFQGLWIDGKQNVDFVLIQQVEQDEEWVEVLTHHPCESAPV